MGFKAYYMALYLNKIRLGRTKLEMLKTVFSQFLITVLIAGMFPVSVFAIDTSASLGDEVSVAPASSSIGDEVVSSTVASVTSVSLGDESGTSVIGIPNIPASTSVGDEISSLPPTSSSLGDNAVSLSVTASVGDEVVSVLSVSGSVGDENIVLVPAVSGSVGDEGASVIVTTGSTGDEVVSQLNVSSSIGDEILTPPATSASVGDEVARHLITSGSIGDEVAILPITSASIGDENLSSTLVTSASVGDENLSSTLVTSASVGDEVITHLVISGSIGDEVITLPPVVASLGDEVITLPPVVASLGDEVISSGGGSTGGGGGGGGIVTPPPSVCPTASISSPLSVSTVVSQPFSYTFSAITSPVTGGTFTFSLGNSLPAGLSFDSSTRVISGTPAVTGTFNIQVTVSNPCGSSTSTLVIVVTPGAVVSCSIPSVSSALAVSGTLNQAFAYTFTATTTQATSSLSTFAIPGALPSGLSFSTSTATISGIPTQSGTYNIPLSVSNPCGSSNAILVITVPVVSSGGGSSGGGGGGGGGGSVSIPTPPASNGGGNSGTIPPASNGGGGGGGGGGTLILVSNSSVCPVGQGSVEVNWYTNYETGGRVLFGTSSVSVLGVAPLFGYQNGTDKNTVGTTTHKVIINGLISGTTYFFRAASGFSQIGYTESVGNEISIVVGSGAQCKTASTLTQVSPGNLNVACPYIEDYMRLDLNNNVEQVYRLQNFLKVVQGLDVDSNGVFDAKTKVAVIAFQNKYKEDVLMPWGSNSKATGYVYIMTKQKINQIMCGGSLQRPNEQKIVNDHRTEPSVTPTTSNEPQFTTPPQEELEIIGLVGDETDKVNDISATTTVGNMQLTASAYYSSLTDLLNYNFHVDINLGLLLIVVLLVSIIGLLVYLKRKELRNRWGIWLERRKGQDYKGQ
ncbi:MAG: hypothetical protein EXS46_01630 [Candidatus Taylorbacteria bacterium]|nr:hypothetical protein [Candidatus Taylorbacteria bacterium]